MVLGCTHLFGYQGSSSILSVNVNHLLCSILGGRRCWRQNSSQNKDFALMEFAVEIFSYYYYLHIFCELHLQISWSSTCCPLLFFSIHLTNILLRSMRNVKLRQSISQFTQRLFCLTSSYIQTKVFFSKYRSEQLTCHYIVHSVKGFFLKNKGQNVCDFWHFIFIINVWPHCVAAV